MTIHGDWIPAIHAGMTGLRGNSFLTRSNLSPWKRSRVYMLASERIGTLYVGVTSNLIKRVAEHRQEIMDGFTKRYGIHRLVWYEIHEQMETAILREKQIKKWDRRTKLRLIEQRNPTWQDLWTGLVSPSQDTDAEL